MVEVEVSSSGFGFFVLELGRGFVPPMRRLTLGCEIER